MIENYKKYQDPDNFLRAKWRVSFTDREGRLVPKEGCIFPAFDFFVIL
jgi:hypothetical protein